MELTSKYSSNWIENIRIGLFSVLTGKVTEKYRDPAIILSSILLEKLKPSWIWGEKVTKYFQLERK